MSGLCHSNPSEKRQASYPSKTYYVEMTEQTWSDFTNVSQERVGSLPTPITEGVDGVGKTIPPELEEKAARLTALNMLQVINRLPNIEVGSFQTNTNQG